MPNERGAVVIGTPEPGGVRASLRRPRMRPRIGPHTIAIIEAGDGIFELSCKCGSQTYTPWGLEHAKARAREHYIATGTSIPKEAW